MSKSSSIQNFYQNHASRVDQAKKKLGKPLTYTEKILLSHINGEVDSSMARGESYTYFTPDRVAMQDATAQMALLQFMCSGKQTTSVPTSVHCDHLILAQDGAEEDLPRSTSENKEVYDFLKDVCEKYMIDFWGPGSGIIHQVVLENYAMPGGLMIGTDSHTPNAGGLGMVAIGVGGADAVDGMAGLPWELKYPKVLGVHLTGQMNGWTSPKDVILKLAGILTVKGGTGFIIEYFGSGCETISCTGKGTICNMGAEIGATTSLFPYDERMSSYLKITGREKIALAADEHKDHLRADNEVYANPDNFYDQIIEINLSQLEPHINGPYSPDRAWKVSEFESAVKDNEYPKELKVALIGSCTNSSYEDINRAVSICKQAKEKGLKVKCPLTISPGSEQIRATIERDGQLEALKEAGATVLSNACGPCIGQWKRSDVSYGEKNSIITSFNRNFAGRNDANPGTHSFVASPEIVVAYALKGDLCFNPLKDALKNNEGEDVLLDPPTGDEFPEGGFVQVQGPIRLDSPKPQMNIKVDPKSERIHLLEPFKAWSDGDFNEARLLVKVAGKCTTDHISPAGKWLRFRGHLDNISNNLLIGANNAFRDEVGNGWNFETEAVEPLSQVARSYKAKGVSWVIVGDDNYGEGSSREHAAMEPRHLGALAVIVKSFARIHETNLKKQGLLALTFANPDDYDLIQEGDLFTFENLDHFRPGAPVMVSLLHSDGSKDQLELNHTYNEAQIDWFHKGCALNAINK